MWAVYRRMRLLKIWLDIWIYYINWRFLSTWVDKVRS